MQCPITRFQILANGVWTAKLLKTIQLGVAPARWQASSKSDCYKFGTWNVRSLFQVGKLAGIVQEMERTDLDLLGISETFWSDSGEFKTTIPTSDNIYRVIHSGGSNNRKGVAFIANKKVANAIKYYELRTERIICLKIQAKPTNRSHHNPSLCIE